MAHTQIRETPAVVHDANPGRFTKELLPDVAAAFAPRCFAAPAAERTLQQRPGENGPKADLAGGGLSRTTHPVAKCPHAATETPAEKRDLLRPVHSA